MGLGRPWSPQCASTGPGTEASNLAIHLCKQLLSEGARKAQDLDRDDSNYWTDGETEATWRTKSGTEAPLLCQRLSLPKTFPVPTAGLLRALTTPPPPTHTPVRWMQTFWCVDAQAPQDLHGLSGANFPIFLPTCDGHTLFQVLLLPQAHRCGADLLPCTSPRLGLRIDIGTTPLTSPSYR